MSGGCSLSLPAWNGVPWLAGGCEYWELICFPSAPAIPPVIMNALEKRAFLKVLVVLGWEGEQGDTPLACGSADTPRGWRPVGKQAPSCPVHPPDAQPLPVPGSGTRI